MSTSTDFGLLVGRYNTAAPTLAPDNALRELRLDVGGRLTSRLADGNDKTLSFFADGDAVGSGIGDGSDTAGDRGVMILGKDAEDSLYRPIRVKSDGSIVIAPNAGTDQSEAADKANSNEGQVTLSGGSWALVQAKAITTGHMHVSGWSYGSDKNTIFQLALAVHSGAGSPIRSEVTEVLDTQWSASSRPSDHVAFGRELDRAGAANTYLCVFAKQLQAGNAGVGAAMMNFETTT